MKKKLLIVFAILVLFSLAACSGDSKPVADNPPANSTTPENAQTASPDPDNEKSPAPDTGSETVEYLQGDELIALFQKVYDDVAKQDYPQEYRLQTEVLFLQEYNDTGKELPPDYEEQYLDWRPENKAAEPESDVSAEPQQPSNPQPSNPSAQQPSTPPAQQPSGGNSGTSGDSDGNGIPDIFEGQGTSTPGHNSDHTGDNFSGDVSSDTDHDYSGITVGPSSETNLEDKDGNGIPDIMQGEGAEEGVTSDYTDLEAGTGENIDIDHDYSGITIN